MKVAITYHEDFGRHGFSVLKERIQPSFEKLMESGLVDGIEVQVFRAKPAPMELVAKAHTEGHMANMETDQYRDVAILSAGSVMMAAEMVAAGQAESAFAFTGTAGHHASRGSCWGFCYFNDVAITILRLKEMGFERFLIVDVDPHFGDGTRDFFREDPDVFHINLHSGTGEEHDPQRNNYDIGLSFGADNERFLSALKSGLVLARDFDFQIAFVIFGHDSHQDDYGGFNLTFEAYPRMAQIVKEAVGDKGLVFVLSGGSCVHVGERVIPDIVRVLSGRWPY
ncbi:MULTISPECIES: histone deacetylase [Methanothrix]|jgi:acetoin utilization deacetylase AcuC-like enzyme|uniref:Histone deacetylase family protein n=3 Tax=root TaxID=1 RepID=F4BX25_METSG|nr:MULTISPECIES: histone deacetylase [Methanothrix]NYT09809.1 histone deacetylase [Methanosarcinales archaeon]AEB67415.1 histone deacetylase family protein [Methanothrix soehngenii GP6]MBP7067256.1 histone deacetylase [Methanothrix sp.]MDD3551779.1 histone deacetylase [Methanothrix soehngenii]MDY0412285.1 histone deacetylase [Methanothrix soehngenii]